MLHHRDDGGAFTLTGAGTAYPPLRRECAPFCVQGVGCDGVVAFDADKRGHVGLSVK